MIVHSVHGKMNLKNLLGFESDGEGYSRNLRSFPNFDGLNIIPISRMNIQTEYKAKSDRTVSSHKGLVAKSFTITQTRIEVNMK